MGETPLAHLIAEATNLAGGNTCAAGHDWQSNGGRRCPHGSEDCSQPVYECSRCGEVDYGEPGGPGDEDCSEGGCSEDARQIVMARRAMEEDPAAEDWAERCAGAHGLPPHHPC